MKYFSSFHCQNLFSHLLFTTMKLTSFFVDLLSFLQSSKLAKRKGFALIMQGIVGIQANGLFSSCQRLLVALECIECIALELVGIDIVGIQTDDLVSCYY